MEFLHKLYYGNTVLEWLTGLGIILLGLVAGKIIYWILNNIVKKITSKTKTNLDDILIDKLEEPIALAVVIASYFIAINYLSLDAVNNLDKVMYGIGNFALIINGTWLLARTLDAMIEEYVVPITEKTESTFDDQVLPIVRKGGRAVIWIVGLIVGLDNVGLNVTGMVAGLGIGGLALALAAQDAVKNVFGGIMIFLDKPFEMGQRVQVNGFDGTVEEVGLRSTRIRTLEGRMVTIPNSNFSDNSIVNVSSEPNRKIVLNLGLTYDTTPDRMDFAMQLLNKILTENQDLVESDYSIAFNAFGDFSLGILVVYRIKSGADILATQTKINSTILRLFNDEKLEFAFPTQTIFKKEL